jgi:hypothetical protein
MTIDSISNQNLLHYKIQAILRANTFEDFSYVGVIDGEHTYNISGNLVPVSCIEDIEEI